MVRSSVLSPARRWNSVPVLECAAECRLRGVADILGDERDRKRSFAEPVAGRVQTYVREIGGRRLSDVGKEPRSKCRPGKVAARTDRASAVQSHNQRDRALLCRWAVGHVFLGDSVSSRLHEWPIQPVLNEYLIQGSAISQSTLGAVTSLQLHQALSPQRSLDMAILVVSIVPILVIYPFIQKHFTKGVLTGAIKR